MLRLEESRAGYYPHDGESPAPVNLTGLDARLILGLIKFEGLNESFDQMAEVSLVLIGNDVSGPSDVVSEDYNLIPDGEIGRAHVCTPVPTAHLVCRLLLEKNTQRHRTNTVRPRTRPLYSQSRPS